MSDWDLQKLKDLPVPDANPTRKGDALDAAMVAFEANEKIFPAKTKGSANRSRPKGVSSTSLWEWIMNSRYYVGPVAAGLLIAPLAVHLSLQHMDADYPNVFTDRAPMDLKENEVRPSSQKMFEESPVSVESDVRAIHTDSEMPAEKPKQDNKTEIYRLYGGTNFGAPSAEPAPSPKPPVPLQNAGSLDGVAEQKEVNANQISGLLPSVAPAPATEMRSKRSGSHALVGSKALSSARHQPQDHIAPPATSAGDRFSQIDRNSFVAVDADPVSTFSIDVDTASYSYVRKLLNIGQLPSPDAVRTEEMVNYFTYDYPLAESADQPFQPTVTVYPSPWNPNTQLMHVGIRAYDVPEDARPPVNLVFLVDVSGSMQAPDKLPLLKASLRLLLSKLDEDDQISIVTYAGSAGTALEPTKASERSKILAALDNLEAGGSTAGAAGIQAAYALANQSKQDGSVNRVILATDGDFNVGVSSDEELKQLISKKRNEGVFLSVLGFGSGNYNDSLMQVLAQNGNGTAAYIDSLAEARKALVAEAGSALVPVAKDVKIQIEFNPATVSEYRLIGYETRALNRADFNNDKVDAGDVNAGHRVTALYEFTPAGSATVYNDALRYKKAASDAGGDQTDELAFLKLRYKLPDSDTSKLMTQPVTKGSAKQSLASVSDEVAFATGVAAFAEKLNGSQFSADFSYDQVRDLAKRGLSSGNGSIRNEFMGLIDLAELLSARK